MKIEHLTTAEVKRILADTDPTAVLPTGSTEQHGPHLPLNTDIYLAERMVLGACGLEKSHALSLPPISYGYNEKELTFAGTVSLTARTFISIIEDIGNSLFQSGWRRLLIVNGHGWNMDLIKTAVHILNQQRGFTAACCSYWSLCTAEVEALRQSEIPGGMAHAGEFETSLMMHLCPDSVAQDLIKDEISYLKSEHHHHDLFKKSPVSIPEPFERLSESGVMGQPELATPQKGKAWCDAVINNLSTFLSDFRTLYPRDEKEK
ncbi:MAG: creatininase family protein [bacterium]|nr:creatininase family protein [bacterium]